MAAKDAWRGAAVTRARLKGMKRLRNQDMGFPEDVRYIQGLKSKKKTGKCQDWQMKRVIKTSMAIKVGDAREHYEEAKKVKGKVWMSRN